MLACLIAWWPFRPEARTTHDPASRPRIGANQVCPAERHEPIAIPPAGPAPGPIALHRATKCSWIRSRPRPASPALTNKSVPHGCNSAAVSLAPSESGPRGTRAVSPRARLGGPCSVRPTRLSRRAERPATQPSESQRARSDHPTSQRRGPSPRARQGALHRATASARVPIPTQARASATGGYEHGPTSRARGGKAQWRRSETSFPNRLAAARSRSWRR
jgi:hypothetical protein